MILLLLALSASAPSPQPLDLGSQRYLLFDDDWLEPGYTVAFVQHKPQKTGVVLEADKPWESLGIWPWNTVLRDDDGVFKMWYDAMTHGVWDKSGPYKGWKAHLAYATSHDGVHWKKPDLGLFEFEGSKRNNIVGQFSQLYGGVFKDPTGPDERRYKITFIGSHNKPAVGWSADGLRWTASSKPFAVPQDTDSSDTMFWDDRLGKYVGYFRYNKWSEQAKRQVWRSETNDFEDWPTPTMNFRADPRFDPPLMGGFYNNSAFKYPWAQHAYVMLPSAFHYPSDMSEIQLAVSRDGVRWRRPGGGRPWIGVGREGQFDSRQVYAAHGVVRVGDQLWFYYTGWTTGHGSVLVKESDHVGKVGRAVLRLDGFVSASGGPCGAMLTTKPLRVAGRTLILNYDAGATGQVRAELRDEANRPLPGFTLDQCKPLYGNQIHGAVSWRSAAALSEAAKEPLRLHLQIRSADVYAFEFRR